VGAQDGEHRYGDAVTGYGMDLDGKVSKDDLTGVDGEKGVDNAWYQAVGCANIARSLGDPKVGDNVIVSRQAPTLVEVTGIDDDHNDDAVEVNVYAAARPLELDARGNTLAWASFKPLSDKTYIAHTKGRITDGVLLTEPFDVTLRMHESIIDSYRELKRARIKATPRPDGHHRGTRRDRDRDGDCCDHRDEALGHRMNGVLVGSAAVVAGRDVLLGERSLVGLERTQSVRADQRGDVVGDPVHAWKPSPSSSRRRESATCVRDFTVPSGSPRCSAISLWLRPLK